jgi:hypothetical protein
LRNYLETSSTPSLHKQVWRSAAFPQEKPHLVAIACGV